MADNYYDPVRGYQFGQYAGPRPPQPNMPMRPPGGMVGPAPPVTGGNQPGNIDLTNRPQVRNPDGSISTVRSASFNIDGHEVLLPTVSDDGRNLSEDEAVDLYLQSGKNLGKFTAPDEATAHAKRLHNDQATMLSATTAASPRAPKRKRRAIP